MPLPIERGSRGRCSVTRTCNIILVVSFVHYPMSCNNTTRVRVHVARMKDALRVHTRRTKNLEFDTSCYVNTRKNSSRKY